MKVTLLILSIFLFSCSQELLPLNSQAPDFSLKDGKGATITLSEEIQKSRVILVFYPGDNTPVCKKQLCEMRDNYELLQSEGYIVLGINDGDAESHKKFKVKNNYPFPLLIDEDRNIADQYQSKSKFGVKRTVYVISREGKVLFAQRGKPSSLSILEALEK